jgi:endogenous inhibitor of DNA gyrase (YacG/DUF329 family)
MSTMVCPTCQQEFEPSDAPHMPFCSKRCQLIDLGRWLGEKPSVPWLGTHDEDEDGGGEQIGGQHGDD